jgi:hypothetical protein
MLGGDNMQAMIWTLALAYKGNKNPRKIMLEIFHRELKKIPRSRQWKSYVRINEQKFRKPRKKNLKK